MITPSYSPTATERVLPRMALDFTTGVLDPRVTVTRALNTATRVNSSGLIEIVNANLPRFDYNPATLAAKGLLIEEARTNALTYSQEFDNVIWSQNNVVVSQNAAVSPDGTTTAELVSEVAVATSHLWSQTSAYTSGVSYTLSVYMKKGTGATAPDWMQLTFGSAAFGASQYANFNLATGVVGTVLGGTATIQNAGSGWYRLSFTATATATTSTPGAFGFINNTNASARLPTYTGATTSDVLVWGAQVEAGAFATSYIPTTTTSLTRNADRVSMTGTNFSSWYNTSQGTIAVQGDTLTVSNSNSMTICSFLLNSSNITRFWMWSGQPANLRYNIVAGGATSAEIVKAITANTRFNAVGSYKTDLFQYALNGGATTADASGAVPTGLTAFYIGSLDSVNEPLSGHIAKINFYSQSLTSNEVQAFSK